MRSEQTIERFSDLVEWLEHGCKPPAEHRIGLELETFTFHRGDHRAADYYEASGIKDILDFLVARTGWQPQLEDGHPISLHSADAAAVTLEPASQIELSSAPARSLEALHQQLIAWRGHLHAASDELGVGFLASGVAPFWNLDESPRVPKARYDIMRRYMPRVGSRGLDMMHRTATTQVALDFSSETDMVRKLRVGLALQPFVASMFARSPFAHGGTNGYLSERNAIWLDTDNHRCGLLDFVFEPGMDFERYSRYALDVPMYFLPDKDGYKDAAGLDFKDFMRGKLPGFHRRLPTLREWDSHLTTIFPEVRLKHYLEMRGADSCSEEDAMALAALWWGLLYDSDALQGAYDLAMSYSKHERDAIYRNTPKSGMATALRKYSAGDVCKEIVEIADMGLRNAASTNRLSKNRNAKPPRAEQSDTAEPAANLQEYLNPIREVVASRQAPAQRLLSAYHGSWKQDLSNIYAVCDFSQQPRFEVE